VLHRSSAVPQTHNKTIAALCVRAGWFCSGVQLSSYPSTGMEGGNSPKGGRISPLLSGMKTVNPAVVPSPREMVRIATAPSLTGRACTHAGWLPHPGVRSGAVYATERAVLPSCRLPTPGRQGTCVAGACCVCENRPLTQRLFLRSACAVVNRARCSGFRRASGWCRRERQQVWLPTRWPVQPRGLRRDVASLLKRTSLSWMYDDDDVLG
jgi:hypothetical protein